MKHASVLAGVSCLSGAFCNPLPSWGNILPYESTLRDRLWMWGHDAGSTNGQFNIPPGGKILPAEAIAYMGIPNVCMIRWRSMPEPPFDEYVKQFVKTKRLAWSIVDGARQPYEEKKAMAFELADKLPNLVSVYLDDFFIDDAVPKKKEAPANLTVAGVKTLKEELDARKRRLDLSLVLYSNQLHPAIANHIRYVDVVSFWTWKAADLANLKRNFETYRKIIPDKRTLLGIYMWDFGGSKPITLELMKHQCKHALQWFEEGKIEGMIFHCTPLCDMKLEAVEWAKSWIAEHGDRKAGV
jgi:hypothetical protein